jgi:hypothetical protein
MSLISALAYAHGIRLILSGSIKQTMCVHGEKAILIKLRRELIWQTKSRRREEENELYFICRVILGRKRSQTFIEISAMNVN